MSVNDISLSHYLYASMLTDWNGTALDSTAGISRAVNATATMSVSAGNLICNIAVTVAKTNCRFSAEFQGTALLSTAVIP